MRTIEEIKAEYEMIKAMLPEGITDTDLCELEYELRNALIYGISLDRLEAICTAEKEGRCVVLPCKAGDTIYKTEADKTISRWFIYGIIKYDGQAWAVKAKNIKNKWRYVDITIMFSDFGKTVFLDKQSAQEALKVRENE